MNLSTVLTRASLLRMSALDCEKVIYEEGNENYSWRLVQKNTDQEETEAMVVSHREKTTY